VIVHSSISPITFKQVTMKLSALAFATILVLSAADFDDSKFKNGLVPFRTLAAEDDAPALTDGCTQNQYTRISFQVEDAQNLPLPADPSEMSIAIKWSENDVKITHVGNDTVIEPNTVSSVAVVASPDRDASWKEDGWFDFEQKCGEDRVTFEIWEKSTGTKVLEYVTRASVADYFELVGESTSCWFIERESEPVLDFEGGVPDSHLKSRTIYLKWCVKVTCGEDDSCHKPVSTLAWLTILSLFLLPAALCLCCLCCMSSTAGKMFQHASTCTQELWRCGRRGGCCGGRRDASARVGDEEQRGREGGQEGGGGGLTSERLRRQRGASGREIELGAIAAPTPPVARVNYIKVKHSSMTLDSMREHRSSTTGNGGRGSHNGENGDDGDEDLTCAICLSDLQRTESVKQLKCGHVFHSACVDLWGETAHTCPLCKMDFCQPATSDDPNNSHGGSGGQERRAPPRRQTSQRAQAVEDEEVGGQEGVRGGPAASSFAGRLLSMSFLARGGRVQRVPVRDVDNDGNLRPPSDDSVVAEEPTSAAALTTGAQQQEGDVVASGGMEATI